MPDIDCLRCINSACCRDYEVSVTRDDYLSYVDMGLGDNFTRVSDEVLAKTPVVKATKELIRIIENMSADRFALVNKRDDNYCVLLDDEMKCSIYDIRPRCCADYTVDRCEDKRWLV